MNVFGFLARAYTGGDVPSPSAVTTLSGRTLHSLYAISFMVYSLNSGADWAHTYWAAQGWTVSFPLEGWVVVGMVVASTAGSVLTFLLLVLCVESAFARGLDFDPYRTGCLMIWEKWSRWLLGFNCFRVAFLVLLLQDGPMTLLNFFFISACRLPNPRLHFWPLGLVGLAKVTSLSWRLVMLLAAYKHFWAYQLAPASAFADSAYRQPTSSQELSTLVGLERERLSHYDECWPTRYSLWRLWRQPADDAALEAQYNSLPTTAAPNSVHFRPRKASLARRGLGRLWRGLWRSLACCCLCAALQSGMCLLCCTPCLGHYCCRRNASQHRHRFARSWTRLCSTVYNVVVFVGSLVAGTGLLVVNLIWLSSVQALGSNALPPELSQTCVRVDVVSKTFQPVLLPDLPLPANATHFLDCKPIFEQAQGAWGWSWGRRKPTPWQKVEVIAGGAEFLSLWLDLEVGWDARAGAREPRLLFDFLSESRGLECREPEAAGWSVVDGSAKPLVWPYFRGCAQRYRLVRVDRLSCNTSRIDPQAFFHKNNAWWLRSSNRRRRLQ